MKISFLAALCCLSALAPQTQAAPMRTAPVQHKIKKTAPVARVVLIRSWKTQGFIGSPVFSPTERYVVWSSVVNSPGGEETNLNCFDLTQNKLAWQIRSRSEIQSAAFSPNGKTLAYSEARWRQTGEGVNDIRIVDAVSGRLKRTFAAVAPYEITGGLSYSPDGQMLICGSFNTTGNEISNQGHYDMAVLCFDVRTGKQKRTLHGLHWGHTTNVEFSPDGTLVAATTFAGDAGIGELAIWRAATGQRLHYFGEGNWSRATFLDNHHLLAGSTRISLYGKRAVLHEYPDNSSEPSFLGAKRPGAVVLVVKETRAVSVFEAWQAKPRKKLLSLALQENHFARAISPSQKTFALAYNDEIRVWRVK